MVATEEMDEVSLLEAQHIWDELVLITKNAVAELNKLGVHKQWANRPLEWFGYIDVLISSTDWANFMALRDDEAAQPEIYSVAQVIKQLLEESTPKLLDGRKVANEAWHMPYIDYEKDFVAVMNEVPNVNPEDIHEILRKISVARCARLSIRPFDGDSSIGKELARYERLIISRPVHASPAEHIATPDTIVPRVTQDIAPAYWENRQEHGNFYGWRQYRKMIPENTILDRAE